MITGRVEGPHALLPITFRRANSPNLSIEFVIDTGFTGFLTLSPAAVAALQLPYLEDVSANLANDTNVALAVYVATILWNGVEREVRVLATGRHPLLGTALLERHELIVHLAEDGLVTGDTFYRDNSPTACDMTSGEN